MAEAISINQDTLSESEWFQVDFIVHGHPIAKERGRPAVRNGRKTMIIPGKTLAYQEQVYWSALHAMRQLKIFAPVKIPVNVIMVLYYTPPKSWSAQKRAAALAQDVVCKTASDTDNVIKSVLDGAKSAVYVDDDQVIDVQTFKRWSEREHAAVRVVAWQPRAVPA